MTDSYYQYETTVDTFLPRNNIDDIQFIEYFPEKRLCDIEITEYKQILNYTLQELSSLLNREVREIKYLHDRRFMTIYMNTSNIDKMRDEANSIKDLLDSLDQD